MPPGQDDNPFGARGAWGRQPPTRFGLSTPVKRPARPSTQIRVPAPGLAPRNILTGGVVPRPSPTPPRPPPAPETAPETAPPAVEPPAPSLVSDPVLARASGTPSGRVGGLPFPPVAGIGVVIAAIVGAGLMLLRHEPPTPEPAAIATPEAPAPQPVTAAISDPVVAPPPAPRVRTARTTSEPVSRRAAPAPEMLAPEAPAPITPPPLAAPPIVVAPPPPVPAAAVPPPTDPEAPMTTRLPTPQ